MIYITGYTHAEFYRFMDYSLKERGFLLTENDYVFVCGDFGMCWTREEGYFEKFCEFFSKLPFTVLWVQGNHENYDMIAEFPAEEWNGGRVRHILRDKVILLERGRYSILRGIPSLPLVEQPPTTSREVSLSARTNCSNGR